MKKHYLVILFGVLALAIASCGDANGGNKKNGTKKANPCGMTEKKANPCGKTEKKANPCGKTETKANPCGKTEKKANPCGMTETKANPCGKTETKADDMKKGAMKAEDMKKGAMKAEDMKKGAMKAEDMKKGAMKAHDIKKDGVEKTAVHTASPKKGKKLFRANGCAGCHDTKTGMGTKPYPSLPHMASISSADFKSCILDGRKGTAMVAFKGKISEADVHSIRAYIMKYKGK